MTPDLVARLGEAVGASNVLSADAIPDDYAHDEALTATPVLPLAVVRPGNAQEVAAVLRVASDLAVPVTARGSGTGLSGACIPRADGIVCSFERMQRIVEIDLDNHVAVVEPGVTLDQLDEALAPHNLVYPVFPGEQSASLGGNVATNAGGMRAVKYGVTRNQVLGLQAVLATGEVIRTGGKFVKATTGYDLTQLVIGSEGTLAIVTEATLKLYPRPPEIATVLVPFATLEDVAGAVPHIVRSGIDPMVLEYVDGTGMTLLAANVGLDLGIPEEVQSACAAYLIVVVEGHHAERVEADLIRLADLVGELGALDVYVLPPRSGALLIEAREKAFWVIKGMGANDIVDVVVPRASVPEYLAKVRAIGEEHGTFIGAAGH
ncbi:MAG TPA: FAD-binding oxidoreductase, partial [Acidimicrobiia bacterium]|nr:FAD-binding oxidoreductase [Acidimicrobiia bacterium]